MDENARAREFGTKVVSVCYGESAMLLGGAEGGPTMRVTDTGPYVVIDVVDKDGHLVAYSETSSLEDVGRDVEEFAYDFFSADAVKSFVENINAIEL